MRQNSHSRVECLVLIEIFVIDWGRVENNKQKKKMMSVNFLLRFSFSTFKWFSSPSSESESKLPSFYWLFYSPTWSCFFSRFSWNRETRENTREAAKSRSKIKLSFKYWFNWSEPDFEMYLEAGNKKSQEMYCCGNRSQWFGSSTTNFLWASSLEASKCFSEKFPINQNQQLCSFLPPQLVRNTKLNHTSDSEEKEIERIVMAINLFSRFMIRNLRLNGLESKSLNIFTFPLICIPSLELAA